MKWVQCTCAPHMHRRIPRLKLLLTPLASCKLKELLQPETLFLGSGSGTYYKILQCKLCDFRIG